MPVQIRKDAPSGTIVINRPDKRNAINSLLVAELSQAFDDFMQERSVRAVVLTGSGNTFCAGSDLGEIQSTAETPDCMATWFQESQQLKSLIETILRFPKPVIAAINGPVMGIGTALMLAADVVIAGESAAVGFPEARRGLSAGFTLPLLSFRVGAGCAASLMLTGNTLNARQSLARGLIHEVVPDDFVWARSNEVAADCAAGARESHQMTKQLVNETIGEAMLTQLATAAANTAAARTTDAAKEGIAAFLEKREPKWD
jgi:enoyl-CoA hydratase/carnithine racemase